MYKKKITGCEEQLRNTTGLQKTIYKHNCKKSILFKHTFSDILGILFTAVS